MAGDGNIQNSYANLRKQVIQKKELGERAEALSNKKNQLLNSIMADGKVTKEEAQALGLTKEYDVSTQEGKDAFLLAYKKVEMLKAFLDKPVDTEPPQFF